MVTDRGIKADLAKIKAIIDMSSPQTQTEVKDFMARLQYISHFINQLTSMCKLIFKLIKKNDTLEWTAECQEAFEKVKKYHLSPPVLVFLIRISHCCFT